MDMGLSTGARHGNTLWGSAVGSSQGDNPWGCSMGPGLRGRGTKAARLRGRAIILFHTPLLPLGPKELWKHHGGGPGLCWGMYFVQPPSCGVDFALFFLCSLLLCPKTIFLPPAAAATPGPVSASSHSLPLLATLPLLHGKCHCGGFGPCARWLLAPGRCRPHQSCSRRDPAAPLCPGVGPEAIPLFPTGVERPALSHSSLWTV